MNKLKCLLLSSLIIVLFSEHNFAQMILSNLNSEREIPNTSVNRMMPIKTENWNDKHIVSLVHYWGNKGTDGIFIKQGDFIYHKDICAVSAFYLTELGTTATKRVIINNHTITDFCIVNDTIYMCGQSNLGNNFVAYENINIFFNTANNSPLYIYPISIYNSPTFTLTNIDFCISGEGQHRLLLLANDYQMNSAFIFYNILPNNVGLNPYGIYHANECRLLDVVHTNNYIAVLGMKTDSTFTLIRHNIDIVQNYIGKEFVTSELYKLFSDPKHHLAILRKELNHVVVAESTNSVGGIGFNIIDLNNLSILHTQIISDTREGRSKIMDLEFDKLRNILYCLFCNGSSVKDMIIQIHPYKTHGYYAPISHPISYVAGYNLLKDLTLYGDNSQILSLGRTMGLNIYFFDRKCNFNLSNSCDRIGSFYCDTIQKPTIINTFNYFSNTNALTSPQPILLNKNIINYNINCQ